MSYLLNKPLATDKLSISQGDLKGNTNQANTSFGNDHYEFANLTANNGKHKVIHTPDQVIDQPTAVGEPAIYAKAVFTTPQVLQFSRIGNNGIPSPLTTINGNITFVPGFSADILNFAGSTYSLFHVVCSADNGNIIDCTGFFDGVNFTFINATGGNTSVASNGTAIRFSNSSAVAKTVKYSIIFHRIE